MDWLNLTEKYEWLTPTMKEAPFYYDGITPEEYDKENNYFQRHFADYLKNKYTPLWKQNK